MARAKTAPKVESAPRAKPAFNSTEAVAQFETRFEEFVMRSDVDLNTIRALRAFAKEMISTADTQLVGDKVFMKMLKYGLEI